MAISGQRIVVGSLYAEVGSTWNQGAVYIYQRSGSNWVEQPRIFASDGAEWDYFGCAVAISGDTLVVGAYADDIGLNEDQGSSYVFVADGGSWVQQAKLVAADGAALDRFGKAVAIDGDRAVVRASDADVGATTDQGSAYSYTRTGTTWDPEKKLTASDGANWDYLGHAIALDGDTIVVSAPGDDSSRGSVYVFRPYTTLEDTVLQIDGPGVLANDTDSDGDVLRTEDDPVTLPSHGTLRWNWYMYGPPEGGGFEYTPDPDWNGTDTFTYRAYDGEEYSEPVTVTITVTAVADAPVASADGATQVAKLPGAPWDFIGQLGRDLGRHDGRRSGSTR